MNQDKTVKSAADNLALIRADYEEGLCSRRKVAQKHRISRVSLWRYSKELNWVYGRNRDSLMKKVSQLSAERLMAQRADAVEEHAIALSLLREDLMNTDDMTGLKLIEKRADTLIKIIKGERLAYGLPSEIKSDSMGTNNSSTHNEILDSSMDQRAD